MGLLLNHSIEWLTPLLHPCMPGVGHNLAAALAEWVMERDEAGEPATHIHDIEAPRYSCSFGRGRLEAELRGFRPSTTHSALDRALSAAREHGVITTFYTADLLTGEPSFVPSNRLTDVLGAAVAVAAARRDVAAHLKGRPLPVIEIDGVARGAAAIEGQFVRTVETHQPAAIANAVAAIERKVILEYTARVGTDRHEDWLPTGFDAATQMRTLTAALTGAPVLAGPVPVVEYQLSRPIVTAELAELLPVLLTLPKRAYIDRTAADAPAVVTKTRLKVVTASARPARPSKPTATYTKRAGGLPGQDQMREARERRRAAQDDETTRGAA